MDVHVDVATLGDLEGVVDLEAMAAGDGKAGQQEVEIGRPVGRAHLDRLFLGGLGLDGLLEWVGYARHVHLRGPSQWHADQDGAVTVAPADVGRRLLVRDEPEVGGRVGIAEGGDGGCQHHHAGDGPPGGVGELAAIEHLVLAILHDTHMDVEPRASLAGGDLRGEGDVVAVLAGPVADHPLGQHELVCRLLGGAGQELDLVLLVDLPVEGEVAHLRVAVLDLSAGLGDVAHALGPEFVELGEGGGLVIALLVGCREAEVVVSDDVILQLAHRLKGHAGRLMEGGAGLAQGLLGRRLERLALLVEEGAEHRECRERGERIDEGGTEPGEDVKVAIARLDEREEARPVDPLAVAEDGLEIFLVVDDEVERLQAPVAGGIHEVDHLDLLLAYEPDDVRLRELGGGFPEEPDQRVRAH